MKDLLIYFVYFGVRVNDAVKTYKINTYKFLLDFIFQNYQFYDKSSLKEFMESRFFKTKEDVFKKLTLPARTMKNSFEMLVNQVDISINDLPPSSNRIEIKKFFIKTYLCAIESIRNFSMTVSEFRLFGKEMSFSDENRLVFATNLFFEQKKNQEIVDS